VFVSDWINVTFTSIRRRTVFSLFYIFDTIPLLIFSCVQIWVVTLFPDSDIWSRKRHNTSTDLPMDERTFQFMMFGEFSLSYQSQVDSFDLTVKSHSPQLMKISLTKQGENPKPLTPPKKDTTQKRGKFSENTTELLRHWFYTHLEHPYPTREEKDGLMESTGLSRLQIENWFINARKRLLKKL
jgi:hypothetical protein